MGILDDIIASTTDAREAFYADQEIWDTEFDDPMAVSDAVEFERCGRCGSLTDAAKIYATGPYRACKPCTDIIRN